MSRDGPTGDKGRGRRVKCPNCGSPALYSPENPWRPFCSERCKLVDLGAWATGAYRIPVEEEDHGFDPDRDD
ncbi:MAG: DNA gyrase inhibitor YacG [Betaproteobacteria bacterium]|nr:DNA gyrase inhibitor YacG [Betaproteobacteria bacterium]